MRGVLSVLIAFFIFFMSLIVILQKILENASDARQSDNCVQSNALKKQPRYQKRRTPAGVLKCFVKRTGIYLRSLAAVTFPCAARPKAQRYSFRN